MITQIYEIQSPEEVEPLCRIGVDHIGSVLLTAEEWRQPVVRETVQTVQKSDRKSALIPLFNSPDTIYRTLDYYRPDLVHFCDLVSLDGKGEKRCRRLVDLQRRVRGRFPGIAIMRSIPIGRSREHLNVATLALAEMFQPVSDYFLTDTLLSVQSQPLSQPVDGFVGITGQTCHWGTARDLVAVSEIPVILAGGLSPENVAEAVRQVRPAGVDSCTCTNRLDAMGRPIRFQKDLARVRRFVEEARRVAPQGAANHTMAERPA